MQACPVCRAIQRLPSQCPWGMLNLQKQQRPFLLQLIKFSLFKKMLWLFTIQMKRIIGYSFYSLYTIHCRYLYCIRIRNRTWSYVTVLSRYRSSCLKREQALILATTRIYYPPHATSNVHVHKQCQRLLFTVTHL